jgi:glutathione S-transferase
MAAHIALEEAGATFSTRMFAVHKGETQSEEYRAINPRARVPALHVDGALLTETSAILVYIARLYPEAELLPADPMQEARCLSVMSWLSSTVHATFAHIVRPERFSVAPETHGEIVDTNKATYWSLLQEIDRMISSGPWLFGPRYTLCDPYALVFWGFGRRMRFPMHELESYTSWKDRMIRRPHVFAALKREESLLLET